MTRVATHTDMAGPASGRANLAARLGGWSARHRLVAIGAWLVLVLVTMMAGSAVGQVTMTQAEYGTGESGQAAWLLADAGIKDPAAELDHGLTSRFLT